MSDYSKIKQTPEYREARREVQEMIDRSVGALGRYIDEIGNAVKTAEEKIKALEEHPKAFSMILASIYGALAGADPAIIENIIYNLRMAMNASVQQNAHPAIRAELQKAMIALEALVQVQR